MWPDPSSRATIVTWIKLWKGSMPSARGSWGKYRWCLWNFNFYQRWIMTTCACSLYTDATLRAAGTGYRHDEDASQCELCPAGNSAQREIGCQYRISHPRFQQPIWCWQSGVGVTKRIFSIPLFSTFSVIVKANVSYWISRLYLVGVAAAQLRWHLSNMNVIHGI